MLRRAAAVSQKGVAPARSMAGGRGPSRASSAPAASQTIRAAAMPISRTAASSWRCAAANWFSLR